jgi:hypothetical protein
MAYQDESRGAHAEADAYERFIGSTVEDAAGKKVGTVKAVWEDAAGQPAYLGVATGWLGLGRIHVVPARYADLQDQERPVRLSLPADIIKDAPDFEADYDITPEGEAAVLAYYRESGPGNGFNPDPGDPSLYTGRETTGREPQTSDPERSDWGARTDAPMAYGEAIGRDPGLEAEDKSLAGESEAEEEAGRDRREDPSDRGDIDPGRWAEAPR